jgi:hypothetical protein
MSALQQLAAGVSQSLPFKDMANASLAPWLTWQAYALHSGFLMLHATSYLALLLLLLRLARGISTRFMSFMVQITQGEFVHSKRSIWEMVHAQ